jgi:aerobic-type carbon monoxide dehydrogenase small subunit (CoxS/CutS family)
MKRPVRLRVNGRPVESEVESRTLLSDFLRHDVGLHGTHVGCEHGVCGACTIHLDGEAVRSCLMLALQADGHEITTIESIAGDDTLSPMQAAFQEMHALQCGFCTPGIIMTIESFLRDHPHPTEAEIREELSGNLCRCTGYQAMIAAVNCVIEASAP